MIKFKEYMRWEEGTGAYWLLVDETDMPNRKFIGCYYSREQLTEARSKYAEQQL